MWRRGDGVGPTRCLFRVRGFGVHMGHVPS